MSLNGKVAVVTGASAGIGWAIAQDLARAGAAVVVHARRREKLDELVKAITSTGGKAVAVAGDAAKEQDIEILLAKAGDFSRDLGLAGRLDIVVVNAGRGLSGGLLASDSAKWKDIFDLNVLGASSLMRRAGNLMLEQKAGDLVVIGSVAGHNISPYSAFYGGSKFAIAAIAEAFRREAGPKGVRVTVVKPGIVLTEFQEVAGYGETFYRNIEKLGKVLSAEDVARAVTFVVSQPVHVHINELVIRPTGQDYP